MSAQRPGAPERPIGTTAPQRRDSVATGIALIVAGSLCIPISDACAKWLSGQLPILQVAWMRYASQAFVLLPLAYFAHGSRLWRPNQPLVHVVRAVLLLATLLLFFYCLAVTPLADAVAIFFVSPLFVTMLSALLLKEPVGKWRWSAVIIGFAGAMLIIRPGFDGLGLGALLALASGFTFACYVILTRRFAGTDPAIVTASLTGAIITLALTTTLPFVWVHPPVETLPAVGLLALFGTVFSVCIIVAYERAPAATLAPFGYIEVAAATFFGWLVFSDLPDAIAIVGMLILVASGLVVIWRERRAARVRRKTVSG